MTDLPMLFSSPMVRALEREVWKSGDGKTETRRVASPHNVRLFSGMKLVRPTVELLASALEDAGNVRHVDAGTWVWTAKAFPYQQVERTNWQAEIMPKVGDRIWTRETWAPIDALKSRQPSTNNLAEKGIFRADVGVFHDDVEKWKPAIHQPRWASRFTLIVTQVRLQQLDEITEEDAVREGLSRRGRRGFHWEDEVREPRGGFPTARDAYISLWDHINGEDAWDGKQWVVATTFTVHRCNIDRMPPPTAEATHG